MKDQAAILQARLAKAQEELKTVEERLATAQNRLLKMEIDAIVNGG